MAIINIRESLNRIDKDTDCKYDLVTLYESLPLTDEDRKDIAKMISSNEDAEVIYEEIKKKYPYAESFDDDDISDFEDNYRDDLKYTLLSTKTVYDSDGFTTDYTWYKDNQTGNNVFVFGDIDYYKPEDGYFDYETENDKEALEWFNSYNGFEDDLNESNKAIKSKHYSNKSINESTWAEDSHVFTAITKNKLEYIQEADLWDDMRDEIDDNPLTAGVIVRVYTNTYSTVSPTYSDNTKDEIAKGRKELFKIINKYYEMAKAEQPVDEANKSINESYFPAKTIDAKAQDIADYLGEFMNDPVFLDDIYFDDADTEAMANTFDALNDFVIAYRNGTLNESVEEDALEVADQKISSAKTSINAKQLPAIFRLAKFKPNTINLDMGGGKFDNAAEELAKVDVTNLVYDPYNRTQEHNNEVLSQIRENGGADTATISNVLNVIAEPEARQTVLRNTKKLLKPNGTVYITVYEGDKSEEGKETSSGYQLNKPTKDYVEEIEKVFPNVQRRGKLIIAN